MISVPLLTLLLISSSIFSPHMPIASSLSPSPSPLPSPSPSHSSSYFHRRDPLRHFKYYDGPYDVKSKDYWASAAFTGVHGFAMAGAWIVCGLGFAIVVIGKYFCCGCGTNSPSTTAEIHSDFSYFFVFSLLLLFSLLAMVATGFALSENQHTLQKTKKLEGAVQGAGIEARVTIHRVNKVMNRIETLLCPYDQSTCFLLNTTIHQLGKESHSIKQFMEQIGPLIHEAIWSS